MDGWMDGEGRREIESIKDVSCRSVVLKLLRIWFKEIHVILPSSSELG